MVYILYTHHTEVYLDSLTSNGKSNLFPEAYVPQHKNVNIPRIFAPKEISKWSCRFPVSCLTFSVSPNFGFH